MMITALMIAVFCVVLVYLVNRLKKGKGDSYGNPIGDSGDLETNVSKIKDAWLERSKGVGELNVGRSFASVLHGDLVMTSVDVLCNKQELSKSNLFQYQSRILKMLGSRLNSYHSDALALILKTFNDHESEQFVQYFLEQNLVEQDEFYSGNF